MKLFVLGLLGIVLAFGLSLMFRLGAFKPVTVAIEEAGPFRLVYKEHLGPYHKIVPTIEEVEAWAKESGESCLVSFGEYLDDPKTSDEDRLRSNGGCIVEADWTSRLPEGFLYKEIARREYVIAIFDGAPSISPYKVYPKAFSYIEDMNLKSEPIIIEMYEQKTSDGFKTRYFFPIQR